MAKARPLKPEEAKLWHKIAKTTKPIDPAKMIALQKALPIEKEPEKKLTPAPIAKEAFDRFKQNHQHKQTIYEIADASQHKRVRRGNLNIDATLDLHGHNQELAEINLTTFILHAVENQYRCLLVITGKGTKDNIISSRPFDMWESPRGILRQRLKEWINKPSLRKYIAGISSANAKHGGGGAFYILLKRADIKP